MDNNKNKSKNTYLVVGFGGKGVGDVLVCTAFIRNLAMNDPDAVIDVGVFGNIGRELLQNNPYIRNVYVLDMNYVGFCGRHGWRSKLSYIQGFRKNRYDKAYILSTKLRHAIFPFLVGIRERIGYESYHRGVFLTRKTDEPLDKNIAERFLDLLRLDGKQVFDFHSDIFLSEAEIISVGRILAGYGMHKENKVVALAPFGADMRRTWSISNFWKLADHFASAGIQVLLLGGDGDRQKIADARPPASSKIIDLIGRMSIRETAAIIQQCSFFLGNDSGLGHIAGAVGTRSLILGYHVTKVWYPMAQNVRVLIKDKGCVTCNLDICIGSNGTPPPCLSAISVSEVSALIEKVMYG